MYDRMPLILREEDFAAWLDVTTDQQAVASLLRPYAAAEMECYPVTTAVNNVRNERAECVERVEDQLSGRFELSGQMMLGF